MSKYYEIKCVITTDELITALQSEQNRERLHKAARKQLSDWIEKALALQKEIEDIQ